MQNKQLKSYLKSFIFHFFFYFSFKVFYYYLINNIIVIKGALWMDVFEAINERKSIRRYKETEVENEKLEKY